MTTEQNTNSDVTIRSIAPQRIRVWFSLRTFLVAITLLALALAWIVGPIERERRAAKQLGSVFDSQQPKRVNSHVSFGPYMFYGLRPNLSRGDVGLWQQIRRYFTQHVEIARITKSNDKLANIQTLDLLKQLPKLETLLVNGDPYALPDLDAALPGVTISYAFTHLPNVASGKWKPGDGQYGPGGMYDQAQMFSGPKSSIPPPEERLKIVPTIILMRP